MKNFIKLLMVVLVVGFASCAGGGEDDVIKDIEGNVLYDIQSAEVKVNDVTFYLNADVTNTATYNAETGIFTLKFGLANGDKSYTYSIEEFSFLDKKVDGFQSITSFKWDNKEFNEYSNDGKIDYFNKKGKEIELTFSSVNMWNEKSKDKSLKGEIVLVRK
ncbi:MAG: hypothetical protein LBH46_00240 [Rickettsiales bacterium]|nr:hypothetical protein [Rickettsiales bacterium]